MEIEQLVVGWRLVHLEIARMEHHAERRRDGKHRGIHNAVRHVNELDRERPHRHAVLGLDLVQRHRIEQRMLVEFFFDQRQRERRPIDRDVQVGEKIRHGPDVVLMPVRQDQRLNLLAVLQQVGDVRDDNVHAKQFGFREHHPGVNDDHVLAVAEDHHVHPELAQPPEGECFQLWFAHAIRTSGGIITQGSF
ncbi:MAG: hypothetical protein HW398_14 [Acidobacteria bacterium]|nr:hypothetical protein [Acidobacteriota bacterium]